MQVILLERVRNLGHLGDQVNVKPGYARNFLIPYGKAVSMTKENQVYFETRRVELEKCAADLLAAAEKRAEQLNALTVSIARKATDEGRLYGAIGIHELVEAVVAMKVDVEKREIVLSDGPIRMLGEFSVAVQLHTDVTASVTVVVEAS